MIMAEFTMTLNEISEDNPHETFGLESYPIFDEKYRVQLNQKILDHFWNREIGQETVSMFRLAMRRHMNEQMPLFNQMYLSEKMKIDPLNTVNLSNVIEMTEKTDVDSSATSSNTGEETSTGTTGTTAKARSVASDTPNSMLDEDADYASSANDSVSGSTVDQDGSGTSKSDSTTAGQTTNNSEGKTTNNTTGYSGNQSEMLTRFRETFLNVDMDIITSIEQAGLFMMVWGTGEEYFRRQNYYGFNTIYPRIW